MRGFIVVGAAVLMVATMTVGTAVGAASLWKAPPFASIGIRNVWLDPAVDYREPLAPSVLGIFVETGSPRTECLATLNEAWWDSFPRASLDTFYCAARNPTFDGVNRLEGVYLHVFFSDDVGEDLNLAINVYQEGAKFYGAPRFCGPDNGC